MTKKDLPIEYQNRIERFNRLFSEGTKNEKIQEILKKMSYLDMKCIVLNNC